MDKIHDIEERITRLEQKIDKILYLVEQNGKSAEKMSDHIDFVDGVYETVKAPLSKICNAVSHFSMIKSSAPASTVTSTNMLELPDKKE